MSLSVQHELLSNFKNSKIEIVCLKFSSLKDSNKTFCTDCRILNLLKMKIVYVRGLILYRNTQEFVSKFDSRVTIVSLLINNFFLLISTNAIIDNRIVIMVIKLDK